VSAVRVEVPSEFDAARAGQWGEFQGWLEDFGGQEVQALVTEALTHNFDLQAAAARLEVAAASQRVVDAARYPQLSGSVNASRRGTATDLPGGDIAHDTFDTYGLGLSVIWELDVWGKLKNRTQAAMADAEAEGALYRAAELSLAANTLKSWFSLVEIELQLELARETLQVFEDNLTVVESSYRRGLPNRALDVRLTRANVEAARSTVEARRRQRDAGGRALEVLLGRYPEDDLVVMTNLPTLRADIPAGLPSELLSRRPDLVAAERQLAASLERVKVAQKETLPTISLTASGGTSSGDLRDLLDTERLFWTVAGNLAQPIYQGGRLRAGVDVADANSRQALALFSQSVLEAFREVETLLAAESLLRNEERALNQAATESIAAEALAWQQYQRGLVDIITVLESQRRAFNARSALLGVINNRLQNRLSLVLALGGDFSGREELAETAPVEGAAVEGEQAGQVLAGG
jgi:NodT family efflux transporter outer membrane factor (OMF) lipoprotein